MRKRKLSSGSAYTQSRTFVAACSRCYDCSDESHPLQLARDMISRSYGRVVDTSALVDTSSSQNGNGDEGSAEEDVEEDGQEGEDSDASKEERKDYGESGINNGSAGDAFNCLLPFRDGIMACSTGKLCVKVSTGYRDRYFRY